MLKYVLSLLLIVLHYYSFSIEKQEMKQIELLSSTVAFYEGLEAEKVWPGFRLDEKPAIVHLKSGNLYSFYLSPSPFWTKLQNQRVALASGDHWGITKLMMHPSYPVEGQKTFIFAWGNEEENLPYNLSLLTFVHERFHLYQFDHFNRLEKGARYQDEWNEDNQILIGIENVLLEEFVKEKNFSVREELLKDFIAIQAIRTRKIHSSSLLWEDLQQMMEGLADYVSVKTFDVCPILESFSVEKMVLHMRKKKQGQEFSVVNDALKGRHYFVGSVLGFALDLYGCDWKKYVEKGIPLRVLLERELSLSESEIKERYTRIKNLPSYEEIAWKMRSHLTREKKHLKNLMLSYKNTKGLSVHIQRPLGPMSGGGKKEKSYYLENQSIFSMGETSFSSSHDQLWKLKFISMPFVIEDRKGGRTFKVETCTIKLDGKQIVLEKLERGEVSFKTLSLHNDHCEFSTGQPGTLYLNEEVLEVHFDRYPAFIPFLRSSQPSILPEDHQKSEYHLLQKQ